MINQALFKKGPIVFIHGYAASGAMYFTMFKDMSKEYCLIFIDLIGMGGSSRPNDFSKDFTPEQVVIYFVDYVERWRIAFG